MEKWKEGREERGIGWCVLGLWVSRSYHLEHLLPAFAPCQTTKGFFHSGQLRAVEKASYI